jgi:ribonuclease BN (tRNA processing enzyme)
MSVKLTVVGCSPAWPNPGGAQSGYLLEGSGRLLLDCGAGVLARLREREPWPRIDAIAITHFHLDHFGDLVPWVWGSLFGPGRDVPKPQLWVPPAGSEKLEDLGAQFGRRDMFADAFEVQEYAEGEPFSTSGFEVTAVRMLHYELVTFGFRVAKNGTVLAYSGDSGPCPALARLGRDADLFVCEATLLEAKPEGGTRGHLSAAEAVAAFEQSGARRLLLTHRPRELDLEPGLEQAYDGLEMEI